MEIRKEITTWHTWLGYIFALSIALPRGISTWVFAAWGVLSVLLIIDDFIEKKYHFGKIEKEDVPCLLLIALSLLGLVSALVAESPELVFKKIFGPRFSLFILPLLVLLQRRRIDFRGMIKYYIAGNALSIALSICFVAYKIFSEEGIELYRDFLSNFTEVCTGFTHRTYTGLNILLSYAAMAYLVNGRSLSKREAHVWILYLAVSLVYLLLNNSRIITLCLPLLAISIWLCGARATLRKCLIGGGVLLLVTAALLLLPTRLTQLLTEGGVLGMLANDPRSEIWPSAWELIQSKPLIGYGLDNIESPLVSLYKEHGFLEGVACAYSPHNEYLSEWLQMGIPGLLLLIATLIFWPIPSKKKERILIYPALLAFSVVFLTESLLDRYMGCLSFAFFLSLTYCAHGREKEPVVGEKYIGGLTLLLLIALLMGTISFIGATCFAPREIVKKDNCIDKKEGELYMVQQEDVVSFIHQGICVNRIPFAFCDLKEDESTRFSVLCRCTPDFDGSAIKIIAEKDLEDGTHAPEECAYDLKRKGEWQELCVNLSGKQTILIYFTGETKIHFNDFRGYIYFKKPHFTNN